MDTHTFEPLNDHDRKAMESTHALCATILAHARVWPAVTDKMETPWLERRLGELLHHVYKLAREIASGRPPATCIVLYDVAADDAYYTTCRDFVRKLELGMAKVVIMTNPSREGVHTLADMRALCERIDMRMPYTSQIMLYPAGALDTIVAQYKDPSISSDIEVEHVFA